MAEMQRAQAAARSITFRWLFPWLAAFATAVAGSMVPSHSAAQAQCAGGQGARCSTSGDCALNSAASVCIDGENEATCQIPCDDGFGHPEPSACSLGETCIAGAEPGLGGGDRYYCQTSRFGMDLNLLDACIFHFVEGIPPDLGSQDQCSVTNRLQRMLDQDGSGTFTIFDLDGCVRAFLGEQPCDRVTGECPDNQVYCTQDADCGEGLHCDQQLSRCTRECGLITDRNQRNLVETLDRQCSGNLKTCDYERGQCNDVSLEASTCSVDTDCPVGAYCFLGACQPRCYRSIQCPGSEWFCGTTNICQPKPRDLTDPEPFDPKEYSILFASGAASVDDLNERYDVPLVILNRITKGQVLDDPNVVFGYRLQVTYALKQDPKCQNLAVLTEQEKLDCRVDPKTEAWLTLDNPFGTVFGDGDPKIGVSLNKGFSRVLSPGLYSATVKALFSNGNSTSFTVTYLKPSPSGEYVGRLNVYADGENNLLASTGLTSRLFLHTGANSRVEWDTLLDENNIVEDKEYQDITNGIRVSGYLHANDTVALNWPAALNTAANEIPVKGIYADQLGRMRLIAVIELPADFCRSENGRCNTNVPGEVQMRNVFGRKVRRIVEFIGPYDPESKRFEGVYRETISGLVPYDVTFDGDFSLVQMAQDDAPVQLGPLLGTSASAAVGFPSKTSALQAIDAEIASQCGANAPEAAFFANATAFNNYLRDRFTLDPTGPEPVFPNLIVFEDLVQGAIGQLGRDAGSYLTLRDFFKGKIGICEDEDDENCLEEPVVRCGLALYRKAILSGFVRGSIGTPQAQSGLFCAVRPGDVLQSEDCQHRGEDEPLLTTLQEHNHFFKELFQARTYEAGEGLSDAFYTLYKASFGDPLDAASAYQHKEINLRQALALYDSSLKDLLSPASTHVLFDWPMRFFATEGGVWLQQMHAAANDRMDTLLELIDLRRRVLRSGSQQDLIFAHHVAHQEYLIQAYIATLQRRWQGELMQYAGEGPKMLAKATQLVAKSSDTRNPLGLHPNRIYFENADPQLSNWQNFRSRIEGRLPLAEEKIQRAIDNMKGALEDEATFLENLLLDRQQIEAQLDDVCGADEPLPTSCDVPAQTRAIEQSCSGSNCLTEFKCDGPECGEVVRSFRNAVDESEVACRADTTRYQINGPEGARLCVRGRVGALLQERIALDLQRKDVVRKVQSLIRQLAREQAYLAQTQSANTELTAYLKKQNDKISDQETKIFVANTVFEAASAGAKALNCSVGLSVSCPGSIAEAGIVAYAIGARAAVVGSAQSAMTDAQQAKEIKLQESSQAAELRQLRMNLDNLVTEVENLSAEYQSLVQQLFNLQLQVEDNLYIAQRASDRSREKVSFLVDHLVGRERGSVLVRNKMIEESDQEFQKLLLDTYKMTQAFIHRYNLNKQAEQWTNQVYQLITVRDVRNFLQFLKEEEQNYCGGEGLDCDFINNREVFEFSLQKELFPGLRDIVNPDTGSVLTVGQQFHNIITSSGFLERRKRAYGVSTQVEVPFAIWLNDRGDAGGAPKRYMVGPGDCNHIINGVPGSGTVAVNVVGTRLPRSPGVKFELWRGNTDYVRSCTDKVSANESKINTYVVGWSPNNAFGQLDNPPSFLSLSGELPACINNHQLSDPATAKTQEGCFHYFARDRSLGAPDWRIVIPRIDDDQSWLLGEGLAEHEKPIIEDIVLYIRYNDRPIAID